MATTLTQSCVAVVDSTGLPQFQIISTLTNVLAGDLPSATIFVFQLVDVTNPKGDSFLRVAGIIDLTTLASSRTLAIALGQTTYLSNQFTVVYSDLVTAISAKQQIQARVDSLVSQWQNYTQQFLVPSSFIIPLPVSSIVVAAQNAYTAAVASNIAAQTAVTAAQDAVTAAATTVSDAAAQGAKSAADTVAANAQTTLVQAQANAATASAALDAALITVTALVPGFTP